VSNTFAIFTTGIMGTDAGGVLAVCKCWVFDEYKVVDVSRLDPLTGQSERAPWLNIWLLQVVYLQYFMNCVVNSNLNVSPL
jgi:hypothetical protein